MPSYLQGVEEPLADLRELGFGILAVVRPMVWRMKNGEEAFRGDAASYALYPRRGYFATGSPETSVFHRFSNPCEEGADILRGAITGKLPSGLAVVRCAMELRLRSLGNANWCPRCCGDQAQADTEDPPENPIA